MSGACILRASARAADRRITAAMDWYGEPEAESPVIGPSPGPRRACLGHDPRAGAALGPT